MIEFDHTITRNEAKSFYLNLRDDLGNHFGKDFALAHRTHIAVVDGIDRVTFTQKHHTTQLWGSLKNWYMDNHAEAGTLIHVRFNPQERRKDFPVLHLTLMS